MSQRPTLLTEHFKQVEFWFDVIVLSLLWFASFLLPMYLPFFQSPLANSLMKISALMGTLELLGFFAYHLLGQRTGLLLQGFLGGFVSSTMVFLHFTQKKEFQSFSPRTVGRALLLATIAMLIESCFIVFSLNHNLLVASPILLQIVLLLITVTIMKSPIEASSRDEILVIDEPIIWKKVIYFAFIILVLTYLMKFLNQVLALPVALSSLFMSLFEAHGVLAAALSNLHNSNEQREIHQIVSVILLGSSLSKTFFVLRSPHTALRKIVILPLIISTLIAMSFSFLFLEN